MSTSEISESVWPIVTELRSSYRWAPDQDTRQRILAFARENNRTLLGYDLPSLITATPEFWRSMCEGAVEERLRQLPGRRNF
jgi:hypothetical protein